MKMKNSEDLKLIEGTFLPTEAKEILTSIFSSKIQFHTTKNFSSQVRFGHDDAFSAIRISELNQCLETIFEIITEAEKSNQSVSIHSEISIRLINS